MKLIQQDITTLTNKVFHSDCEKFMRENVPDESVDLIVTDPPYGYSFMGKDWDKAVPSVAIWKECYRVMKSGAFMFVMSSPRQDVLSRMIVNLQDAGFETAFTSMFWTYACLSDDTEILTKNGWELLRMSNKVSNFEIAKSEILIYDRDSGEYKFEIPNKWNIYSIKDTCYSIKSNNTDQLITRNHNCLIEQSGKLLLQTVEEIKKTGVESICVPYLENMCELQKNISNCSCCTKKRKKRRNVLWNFLSPKSKHLETSFGKQEAYTSHVRSDKRKNKTNNDGRKKSRMEGWSNLFQNTWKLYWSKICSMSERIFSNGAEGRLCYGASVDSGKRNSTTSFENRSCSSYRPQSCEQSNRKFNAVFNKQRPQTSRTRTPYKTTLATISERYYEGIVFCPTVTTGCFVARRSGKIFLTGNSGFPKATNISKAVDKKLGVEREVKGKKIKKSGDITAGNFKRDGAYEDIELDITEATSDEAKALDGSYAGFQPKPAVEVILVVMKPLNEKSYTEQALKNGKGITWLDDCRIPYDKNDHVMKYEGYQNNDYKSEYKEDGGTSYKFGNRVQINNEGRFPANLIVSDDALNDGVKYSSGEMKGEQGGFGNSENDYGDNSKGKPAPESISYNDAGSFSRFYDLDKWWEEKLASLPKATQDAFKVFPFLIEPKAAKSEKNRGLEGMKSQLPVSENYGTKKAHPLYEDGRPNKVLPTKNIHPTVKPIKLMSYLITLGSKENDIVFDPFMGSGTTCISAKMLHRKFIGTEMELESFITAQQRVNAVQELLF